jgi:recombinational DNA repair protein RecR
VPTYEISKGKEKVISELRSLSKKASEIILATDPDREGEAIA